MIRKGDWIDCKSAGEPRMRGDDPVKGAHGTVKST